MVHDDQDEVPVNSVPYLQYLVLSPVSNGHWAVFLLQGLEPSLFCGNWSVTVKTPSRSFGTWQSVSGPGHSPRPWGLYRCFPFNQNFRMEQKFPGEVRLETVEFSKCQPFKRKFRQKSWLERKLPGTHFRTFWVNLARPSSFLKI